MQKEKLTPFSLFLLLTAFTMLVACTSSTELPLEGNAIPVTDRPAEEIVGPPVVSYATAASIEELVDLAEVIVIGRVEKSDEIVNTARDPHNPTQPDPHLFGVGQVYYLHIEQYLKGDGAELIHLIQSEGLITPEMPKEDQTIEKAREQRNHIPLSPEKRYLMFLRHVWTITDGTYYVGILEPWRFDISNGATAKPESPWHYAGSVFPSRPVTDFVLQIEQHISHEE